ncbi:MAG: hypothetical protein MUE85_21355 [Microscillaceae bacterium]|jgi:uncharacterized protein (DUF433 family)|nr:hypothetical protein [Microscillaceae bacterium]
MYDRFQENRRIEKSISYTAKLEEKREIAKKLMKRGLSDQEISKDTGLKIEQIQELRTEK